MKNSVFLAIKTADQTVELRLYNNHKFNIYERVMGRQMSRDILGFISDTLEQNGLTWSDLDGLVVFSGPGGYTSLRIGITVANTLSNGLKIPIIGNSGNAWFKQGLERLSAGQNDQVISPIYYQPAVITKPKK